MSVFPSASPSNGTIPEWSCTDESEQTERSTNDVATYVVTYTPVRVYVVARAAHAVLETLRRRPSQGKSVRSLREIAYRDGISEPHQPKIGQLWLVLSINEDVDLYMPRNMSSRK
jgi:hypothetical protein